MKNNRRILVLGIGQSNFLIQLYRDILLKDVRYCVDIDKFFDISKGQVANNSPFKKHYNFHKIKVSFPRSVLNFLNFVTHSFFWEIFFFELGQKVHPKIIFKSLLAYSKAKYIVEKNITPLGYHIFHFHYCTPEHLIYLHFLPKESNIICSFWGSDLMRITGVSNVFYVSRALRKATKITIQSNELAQTLAIKYGRELHSKIVVNQFTINTDIYEQIDAFASNQESIKAFKLKFSIPLDKIVITVSHNAFSANNHIQILQCLLKVNHSCKSRCIFILPMAYGGNQAYIEEVITYCKEQKDLDTLILSTYFDADHTAMLRLSTDLMIQMPISDALSGAMTEVLYAGNSVIAASWLPYGILRNYQIPLIEAFDFDQLPQLVDNFCNNIEAFRAQNKDNARKIKRFLFPDTTTSQWLSLFNQIN